MTDHTAPLVTIMVPAYNHEAFVAECIESLWNQTYRNIEIVVCDDASTDGTRVLLRAMAARSPVPMRLLENETNRGVCATLNRCLAEARGTWIAMIASDDMYMPEFVAANVDRALAEGSPLVCIQSGAWRLRADGSMIRHRPPQHALDGDALEALALGRGYFMPPSFFTSRILHEAVGAFDETLQAEDRDFYLRAAQVAMFRTLDQALVVKRDVPGSLGQAVQATSLEEGFTVLAKSLRDPLLERATRARAWALAGAMARAGEWRRLAQLVRREKIRRGPQAWALWFGAIRGLGVGLAVSVIGQGQAGLLLDRLRGMRRRIFGEPNQQSEKSRI